MEQLLTVKDVAKLLQVTVRTVFRLSYSQDGFPRPIKIGGSVRWRISDMENYINTAQVICGAQESLDETPISVLLLSRRATNCLLSKGIETVGALAKLQDKEMLCIRCLGRTTLREIKRKMANYRV